MRNFYVTTKDIWSGEWSDPVYFEFRGIDPSLFFDDDDRVYIQGSWREGNLMNTKCSIRQFEIDISTGKALSETKLLWNGFADKDDAEGPHIYKKDGYYYLVAAEAGTFEHHMITAARSKDIWGPYESCENNPVLTAFGTEEYVQHTGHGDLFEDGNGDWWAVALGVRNEDGRYPLSRETFLTPVLWQKGGWPEIEHPRMRFQSKAVASESSRSTVSIPDPGYIYIRNPCRAHYDFPSENKITLTPQVMTLSSPTGTTSFLGKRQRLLDSTATATLQLPETTSVRPRTISGLTLYKDAIRHSEIYFDFSTSAVCFGSVQKVKGDSKVERRQVEVQGESVIRFQVKSTAKEYEFNYQVRNSNEWETIGRIDSMDMTAYDFTGTIFGIFASTEEESSSPVIFTEFQLSE
jgi:beta-xylosidase